MTLASKTQAWSQLTQLFATKQDLTIKELFAKDASRAQHFSLTAAGLYLDYSKNRIDAEILQQLVALANEQQLSAKIKAIFAGEKINNTEQRAVLHSALRAEPGQAPECAEREVIAAKEKMAHLVQQLHQQKYLGASGQVITDVVNLGIGGSSLGPEAVITALQSKTVSNLRVHFVASLDSADLLHTLQGLNPETTLFIISSKSFSTIETLLNAKAARSWLADFYGDISFAQQLIAVTANSDKAIDFGVDAKQIYPMWDWVGGRFSLWSAVGLSIAIALGMDAFNDLLAGANAMDQHFREAPFEQNMPVILGLIGIWYRNFFDASSEAVISYDCGLAKLVDHLQQVYMESLGKRVTINGEAVDYATSGVIWGGIGPNGQHAYHQMLHQGTDLIPVDFILPVKSQLPLNQQHQTAQFASCLGQAIALMDGQQTDSNGDELSSHRVLPGNRPSNIIAMEQLTPSTLGALLSLYEHKVFVQGVIWDINPFDQWGVECGKRLANQVLPSLEGQAAEHLDASTQSIIGYFQQKAG